MYKIQVDSILSFYRHKWEIFNMKLIPLVYLPFYNFAFKEYHTVCLSLSQLEKLSSQVNFFKNVTMFLIPCYEYDCNTVGHKVFIMVHSLEYRLSYWEAIYQLH